MTIEEVKLLKKNAELEINKILHELEFKSGTSIDRINYIKTSDDGFGANKLTITSIRTEIKLSIE